MEGALEVDVEDGLDLLHGHLRERLVPEDACVVDHDVDLAEASMAAWTMDFPPSSVDTES